MFDQKTILITGGTGSFGKAMVEYILARGKPKKLIILSRDELKQHDMRQLHSDETPGSIMRYFLGDVRDEARLVRAFEGVDIVIHAAALKQVPAAEYNPSEFIKTNIIGAENVISAALKCGVSKVVALSTDKAAAPINLYGATKLCSDKLFVAANNVKGAHDIRFSVVRYGNVMGSRGSVIPFFLKQRKSGVMPITDERMTRFNITLDEACEMVAYAINNSWGGEIFVPKIPSYRILELAEAIAPGVPTKLVGIRPGEKIHEEMITESDSFSTVDLGKYYAILPVSGQSWSLQDYLSQNRATQVEPGFSINSGRNTQWLGIEEIRTLIRQHVDPDFQA
ncbi:MAG: hypothetical protein RL095_383 [Verrucomicrobiota bacterium]